jgi:protein subunit release factor B
MTAAYSSTDAELLAACVVETFRSHGPGGQHANKTESAVRVTHRATGMTAQCQDHRQRARNQADALHRLRLRLALGIRGQAQRAWLEAHRRGRQLQLGANARDFHLVVAVLLDALAEQRGALAEAAAALGVSSSQLAKLLTADKEVHQAANLLRAGFGSGPIHA